MGMKENTRGGGPLLAEMARIAIPISLQSLITVGVNLMDTIMLSSMGDMQLSASSLAGQFINLFQIFCMGIGMGASVLTSRYWGSRDMVSLKKSVALMLRLSALFIAVFTAVTALFPSLVMRMYTPDSGIIAYGKIYLLWMLPTFFCIGLSQTCTIVLRSVGQVRLPLLASIAAFAVNVFCNWVFIFGKLGAPRMEIAGAALGTMIARIVEFGLVCGYFFFADKRVSFRLRDVVMSCADLKREYVRISLPVLVSDGLLAIGNNAVAMVMGHIGQAFVTANSMTVVVQQLSSVLTQGIANASGIITGHTMGRGDREKAQRDGYTFLLIGLIVGCFAALLIYLLRGVIVAYYQVSDEARTIAWELLDAILFIVIFQSMNAILTKGVLRAGGFIHYRGGSCGDSLGDVGPSVVAAAAHRDEQAARSGLARVVHEGAYLRRGVAVQLQNAAVPDDIFESHFLCPFSERSRSMLYSLSITVLTARTGMPPPWKLFEVGLE